MSTNLPQYPAFTDPNRTFERKQGCWNCKHYDCSDAALAYFLGRIRKDKQILAAQNALVPMARLGAQEDRAEAKMVADARYQFFVKKAKERDIGMCRNSKARVTPPGESTPKPVGDFVTGTLLCDNGWSGKTGVRGLIGLQQSDKTPGELHEIADAKAKIK